MTIEQPSESRNAYGESVRSWSTLATVWASVRPMRGDESFAAGREVAEREAVFRIRYRGDVTPAMRLDYDGAKWDILHIAEIGRREGLDIRAQAKD